VSGSESAASTDSARTHTGSDSERKEKERRRLANKARGKRPVVRSDEPQSPSSVDTITDLSKWNKSAKAVREAPMNIGASKHVSGSGSRAAGTTGADAELEEDPCGWLCGCCLPPMRSRGHGEERAPSSTNTRGTEHRRDSQYGFRTGAETEDSGMKYGLQAPSSYNSFSSLPRSHFDL
jgi:hypothetical protein